ncbi:GGDEF domain-containing protein [Patescibacteria group bacterium]|nr:GGDEF domain-containing protein [Patescibacteria group bacterium]
MGVKDKKIKELEKEIEKLRSLVVTDELTEILNRRGFCEKTEVFFKEAFFVKKNHCAKRKFFVDDLSIIFADIDNFKLVNDTHGHFVGDIVLQLVAKLIEEEVRDIDVVGRLGGEEFVVALIGASEEDCFHIAEEIRGKVEEAKFIPDIENLKVTLSLGVASIKKTDSKQLFDLIRCSDHAMYEAKKNRGKNNTVRYSEISGYQS